MDRTPPAWQYIGEMRCEGVVWFDMNPHAFPLGTRYYALSGDATDMAAEIERLLSELAASQDRERQLRSVAAVPEALTQEPLRGDEPIGPQASRADYVRGWNACRNAMLSAAPAAPAVPACEWSCSDDESAPNTWDGSCGIKWSFIADGPVENGVRFCPKCGGAVKIDAAMQKGGA